MSEQRSVFQAILTALMLAGSLLACSDLGLPVGGDAGQVQNPPLDQGNQLSSVEDGLSAQSGGDDDDGEDGAPGFTLTLSDGSAQPEDSQPLPVVEGQPLSEDAIQRVLARLPELIVDVGAQQEFRLPDESLPPPRTGETIEEVFPPEEAVASPEIESGPLEVLRYAPEGEIPIAPFINVTFNQPMAPLTSLGNLTSADVPVRVEPDLPGTWRWLGTRTLNFQFDSEQIDRLPMATEFTVTIPAGTTSATGGVLAESVQFHFSTPAPHCNPVIPIAVIPSHWSR